MPPLSELTGRDLWWRSNTPLSPPRQAQVDYYLYDGERVAATARATWHRLWHYDLVMMCAEGVYQVHIPLHDPGHRPAVVWRPGEDTSAAAFELVAEGSLTVNGWIDSASGRRFAFEPTLNIGYEYVLFAPGGPRLITVSALAGASIGGNPGHMLIAPEAASDPELPALVALTLALSCEQVLLLHRDAPSGLASWFS